MKTIWAKHKRERAEEKLCIKVIETPWRDFIRKQKYNVTPYKWEKFSIWRRYTCLETQRLLSKVTPRKGKLRLKLNREGNVE